MVAELLGILLALGIAGLVWGLARLWRALRPGLLRRVRRRASAQAARLRGLGLRSARGLARSQAARIAALTAELERTRARLRQAERARDAAVAGARWEGRFRDAKRAFALRFHPDRLRGTPRPERALRIAIFREHWSELQRIERG
jgi:hypothetical protein